MQKSFIPIGWSANTQFTDFLQTIQGDVLKVSTNKQAMAVLQQDGKLTLLGEKAFGGEFCAYNNAKRKCSVINYPSFNKQEKVLDKVMNVFSLKNGFVAVVRGEGLVRWGKQTAAGINSIELKSIDLPATPTSSTVAVKTIEDAIAVRDIGDNETIFWGDSMIYKTSHQSLNLNNVNTSSRFAFYSKGNYGDLYCHVTSDGVFMETYNITVDGTLKRSAATVRNSGSYLCADDVKRLATIPSGALLLKNSGKMQLLLFSRQN